MGIPELELTTRTLTTVYTGSDDPHRLESFLFIYLELRERPYTDTNSNLPTQLAAERRPPVYSILNRHSSSLVSDSAAFSFSKLAVTLNSALL